MTRKPKTQIEKIPAVKGSGLLATWVVKNRNGHVIGVVDKFRNNKTDTHPYRAWKGHVSAEAREFKTFYRQEGGFDAAIAWIEN